MRFEAAVAVVAVGWAAAACTGGPKAPEPVDVTPSVFPSAAAFRHDKRIADTTFAADGRSLWTTTGQNLHHWSVPGGEHLSTEKLPCIALAVAAEPAGDRLALTCLDGLALRTSDGTVEVVKKWEDWSQTSLGVIWGSDGLFGLQGMSAFTLMDVSTFEVVEAFEMPPGGSVTHAGGKWLFVDPIAEEARIWTRDNGFGGTYELGDIDDVAMTLAGDVLMTVGDNKLTYWDLQEGKQLVSIPMPGYVSCFEPVGDGVWVCVDEVTRVFGAKGMLEGELPKLSTDTLIASPVNNEVVVVSDRRPRILTAKGADTAGGLSTQANQFSASADGQVVAAFHYTEAWWTNRRTGDERRWSGRYEDVVVSGDGDFTLFRGDQLLAVNVNGEVIDVGEDRGWEIAADIEEGVFWVFLSTGIHTSSLVRLDLAERRWLEPLDVWPGNDSGPIHVTEEGEVMVALPDGRFWVSGTIER